MLEFTPCEAENLIEKHRKELHSFLLRRVACPDTANDLLQDVFLRLVNLKSAEPIQNPRAFIYRIAANLATDHLRRQHETTSFSETAIDVFADESTGPESVLFSQQQLGLCENVLDELPPLCLKILIMSRFEGLTHKQISEKLGISVSWVEKNIMTALKRCKQALDRPDPK